MTGVVLCGGQSTRMGSDKGLLQHHSATWAQLAAEKLKTLHLLVVLSVNEQQQDVYRNLFQNLILVSDDCTLNLGGPLKGILSVHVQYPQEDLLVLACDMRDMQETILADLVKKHASTHAEAVVFRNGDHIEPLCAVYSARGLQKIYEQYQHGLLKKFSLHYLLHMLNTVYIPVPENWQHAFKNFNTAEDLQAL